METHEIKLMFDCAREEADILSRETKCITPGCGGSKSSISHGLCSSCYIRAKAMVDTGRTTWEELKTMGLATGVIMDPFTKAFLEAEKKNAVSQ